MKIEPFLDRETRERLNQLLVSEKKPTIPDLKVGIKLIFSAYSGGGSLHCVLEDLNVDDSSVRFCIENARSKQDEDGELLASLLLRMSRTQRLKLART